MFLYYLPMVLLGCAGFQVFLIRTKQGYVIPNFDTYAIFLDTGFINTQHMLLGIAFQLGVYRLLIGALVATWIDGDPVDDNSWRGTAEHIGSGQSR